MSKRKIYAIKELNIGVIPMGGKNKGKYAIIDYEDMEICQRCNWHMCGQGYVKTRTPENWHVNLHVYIYKHHGYSRGQKVIDHIDGNKLNNKKDNLRLITQQQNTWNRKKHTNNQSGMKGVTFKDNHWVARITIDGKLHQLGFFKMYEDAVNARLKAELEHFGEFRREITDDIKPDIESIERSIRRRNIGKNNTSGFVGVKKTKQGKWLAYITLNKKYHYLGTYFEKESAIKARINAEKQFLNDERKKTDK